MRNMRGSGCCCGKSAKAEDNTGKVEREEKTGCCSSETREPTGAEAAETSASGSDAKTERKGCC